MDSKKKRDWILIILLLGMLIPIVLFIVSFGINIPLLDVTAKSENGNFSITFTGIAEIIVALAFGVGTFMRLTRRK